MHRIPCLLFLSAFSLGLVACSGKGGSDDTGTEETELVNTAPALSSVTISPDPALVSDTLTCSWFGYTDADGDPDQSTLEWGIAGSVVGTSSTLSGVFIGGDTVTCTVTPADGTDTGTAVSASLTISNTAPVLADVSLAPDPAYEADTLTCTPGATTDADGATGLGHGYAWSVDGVDVGETTNTLDGTAFDKGQEVFCTVTPNDGDADGDAVISNSVTIRNTGPGAPLLSFAPAKPVAGEDDLVCQVDTAASDDDEDAVTYTFEWDLDGASYTDTTTTTWTGDTVAAEATALAQEWACTVTPNDGEEDGTAATVSITVSACFAGWEDTETSLADADYAFIGEAAEDTAGYSVSNAGDVDGDGLDDLLIGAHANDDGGSNTGKAYLVLGASLGADTVIDLADADYAFLGEEDVDYAGQSVASAGDVDGDGLDDFLVGALYNNDGGPDAGKAYLVLGASLGADTEIDLSDADYAFIGEAGDDRAGIFLSSAGDVDGDGLDDLLFGAHRNDDGGWDAGKAYLVLGASLGATAEIDLSDADYAFIGEEAYDYARFVSSAGDVDGDGLDDILVSAHSNDDGGADAGKVYLVLGASLGADREIDLRNADYAFIGETKNDYAGIAVAGAGDVDGDGLDDFVISAQNNDDGGTDAGKVYLVLGASLGMGSEIPLEEADYAFTGENERDYARFVSGAGDVNGDGLGDFMIGAYENDDGGTSAGKTYLLLAPTQPCEPP